jgi:hypothetical protein
MKINAADIAFLGLMRYINSDRQIPTAIAKPKLPYSLSLVEPKKAGTIHEENSRKIKLVNATLLD